MQEYKSKRGTFVRETWPNEGWTHDQAKADAFAATFGDCWLAAAIRATPGYNALIAANPAREWEDENAGL